MHLSSDTSARRRLAALCSAAALSLVAGLVVGGGSEQKEGRPTEAQEQRHQAQRVVRRLDLRQQVGQVLVSSFDGTVPPDYIRRRLQAGETAGVILFARNGGSAAHWRDLTRSLQEPARGGALVMVDQEGGPVRTVAFAGPEAGQPFQGPPSAVRRLARDAGAQLRSVGINVDLAPVADVARPGSVMSSRAFAGDEQAVAARTMASVLGFRDAGVAATAKHFPGLGGASVNTDEASATISGSVRSDLVPFRAAIEAKVPLVMLSHALYPALDAGRIASQSSGIATALLRDDLGYGGAIVTDSIEAQAVLQRSDVATAAERSLEAGADLVLMTGSGSWNEVFPRLLARARDSQELRERVGESAARVLALKRELGLR